MTGRSDKLGSESWSFAHVCNRKPGEIHGTETRRQESICQRGKRGCGRISVCCCSGIQRIVCRRNDGVAQRSAVAGESLSAVAAESRGLSVAEMTELRTEARNAGVYMRVVKNTLARRAVEGTEFECMKDSLKGPILLAFAKDDPGAAARVIKDFAKEHEALSAVSLSVGGQLLPGSELSRLAELPTLDQGRAMLLGVMIAPMSKLVRTLAEPPAMLARTMSARGSQEAA